MLPAYFDNELNVRCNHYLKSSIHANNNEAFRFWLRCLTERAKSVFKIDNIPEAWEGTPEEFLEECLIRFGYVVVSKDNTHGLFFQPANLKGFNFYYQPVSAIYVDRTKGKSVELKIGKECELLKLTPDYRGILDVCEYYAEKLALLDSSINSSLVNSKLAYMLFAKNKATAEAYKKAIDRIDSGEPAVVFDNLIKDDALTKDSAIEVVKLFEGSDYITDKLIQDHVSILHDFETEIGIPTLPLEKKERMITDEANSKKVEAVARATVWLDSLNNSLKVINRKYATTMTARLTFDLDQEEEVIENA